MNQINKYADLLIRVGINLQKNQTLVIASPIDCADFARIASIKAYEAGAREVVIRWIDEESTKIRFLMGNDEIFDEVPKWIVEYYNSYAEKDAAFLNILASDPEIYKDVDPKRMTRSGKSQNQALESYRSRLMSNKNVWCVASIPTVPWAKKVFPDVSESEAIDKLWQAIFKSVRVDREDPVSEWKKHQAHLKIKVEYLNKSNFKSLKLKNSIGTDVTVDLPENHVWFGGGDPAPDGYVFIANMPTEEIFTAPRRDGVNGKIVSSMPFIYNGNLIDKFSFTFKDGVVVDYDAEIGKDLLTEMLNIDEGAKRLGEVALVPYDSPISNQKILFYNTLFDENASCHFALGKAYPTCVKNGENMTKDELQKAGINDALVHEDFMVGTSDLEIIGIKDNGTEENIFVNGNFI